MFKECGSCVKCCDGTLAGMVKGHAMYPGKSCFFLKIGGTCGDYENRPQSPCRDYKCLWLEDPNVPDFMKPENANAVIDLEQHKGTWYLRLNKTDKPYSAEVLTYAINYAQSKNISFIWTDQNNGFNYIGDKSFCLDILNDQIKAYKDFIKNV